jgi:hypothetical protein
MAHIVSHMGILLIILTCVGGCDSTFDSTNAAPDTASTLDTLVPSDTLQDIEETGDICEEPDCNVGPGGDSVDSDTTPPSEDIVTVDPCEGIDCGSNATCIEASCVCTGGWSGDDCDQLEAGVIPWSEGPYESGIMGTIEDFTIQTLEEPWSLKENWNGKDSCLFIMRYTADDIAQHVWNSSVEDLLNYAPSNTHIFFGSFQNTYLADITDMKERVDNALAALPPFISDSWAGRIHFINQPVASFNGGLKNFIGEMGARFHFAIDRFQRWREVGSLFDWKSYYSEEPTSSWYPMYFVANEALYFNYEANTHQVMKEALDAGATEVIIWDEGDVHPGGWGGGHNSYWDIELPTEDVMINSDTLYLHHSMSCPNHLQEKENGCNEWDYIQHVFLCDTQTNEQTPPDTCDPGGDELPAETTACTCKKPHGPTYESTRTCHEEGSGFGECACDCNVELARWVTPYAREGNWLTDLTPFMPLLADGGTRRLRFQGANGYAVGGKLIFANLGKPDRPIAAQYLWGNPVGTGFNEEYNSKHDPIVANVAQGATRAEIVAVISGHGSGTTEANCAEFCDHHHQFNVNDAPSHTKSHPKVNTWYGCMDETINGGVPNQYGTWVFGRAGWCAGMDVKPWAADITGDLVEGENILYYQGLFQGVNYVPVFSGSGDYNPEIKMTSWLISYGSTE